jgi:L-fuconolactonase
MIDRRNALKMLGGAALGTALGARLDAARTDIPIIDAHIHLFDTGRPGGVPWPEKSDTAIYKPALPDRYARLAKPHGVVGAIVVEASPLDRDNEWVLHEAAEYPIIVGFVGDLIPGTSSYARRLDQLRSNPVFVGIRYGNLWNRDLGADMKKPGFVDDLKRLSSHGLELDAANPNPELIRAVVRVSEEVPDLRIVIDHLPNAALPDAVEQQQEYWTNLKTLSQNPRVFIKLSEIPARVNGRISNEHLVLQRQPRQDLEPVWRGPYFVRKRLAEQRPPAQLPSNILPGPLLCSGKGTSGRGEILLEEFAGCVPLAPPHARSAGTLTGSRDEVASVAQSERPARRSAGLAEQAHPGGVERKPPLFAEPTGGKFGNVKQAVPHAANQFCTVPGKKIARGLTDPSRIGEQAQTLRTTPALVVQNPAEGKQQGGKGCC